MPTYQLKLLTDKQHAEQLETLLFEQGCLSVSLTDSEDQPIFEPDLGTTPLWQNITLLALFAEKPELSHLFELLQQKQPTLKKDALSIEPLPEKDWVRAWMDDYQPMQYGQKLWVVPHEMTPPDPNAINLRLDPGLAFGSGTHPTTRLCLEWIAENDLKGKSIVDFGCGSGILAIAACLCGAKEVVCTDIDPQALEATKINAENNHVSDKIQLYLPNEMPAIKADIVLANILSGPLCDLSSTISKLCVKEGTLVLSGILQDQAAQVTTCYQKYFSRFSQQQIEDWVRLVLNN